MVIIEFIFWICLFTVFYSYIGYIGLLWLLGFFMDDPVKKEAISLSVSLVISVYNEGNVLAEKIENSLGLDYPANLIEIAVISDGSTDNTNNIINEYAKRDSRIMPCIAEKNKGKTPCLNEFVPKLKGDIIIFSDANSFYPEDLCKNIAASFADDRIGFVTGSTKYFSSYGNRTEDVTSLYARVDRYIKFLESKIGSCVGADGAVFAIRKALFTPLESYDINDFVIPMQIVKKGFRGVLEESAFCEEKVSRNIQNEFLRQVRITNRTLRAIFNYKLLLNPFYYPLFSFELLSHKLLKFLSPFLLIIIFILNAMLISNNHILYKAIFIFQILFYLSVIMCGRKKGWGIIGKVATSGYAFVLVNAAYILGWYKYLRGETYTAWLPNR